MAAMAAAAAERRISELTYKSLDGKKISWHRRTLGLVLETYTEELDERIESAAFGDERLVAVISGAHDAHGVRGIHKNILER